MLGLDDVDDGLHQRGRREKLAIVLRPLHREFHQEVFVDTAEDIARGRADLLAVEDAQKVFKDIMIEALIVAGKLALERREVLLDGVHRLDQGLAQVGVLGQRQQVVVARLLGQHQCAALEEVGLDQGAFGHLPGRLVGFDGGKGGVIAIGRVAEKDDPQRRHAVFAGGQVRVGAQLVSGFPEAAFDLLDVLKLVPGHVSNLARWRYEGKTHCIPRSSHRVRFGVGARPVTGVAIDAPERAALQPAVAQPGGCVPAAVPHQFRVFADAGGQWGQCCRTRRTTRGRLVLIRWDLVGVVATTRQYVFPRRSTNQSAREAGLPASCPPQYDCPRALSREAECPTRPRLSEMRESKWPIETQARWEKASSGSGARAWG